MKRARATMEARKGRVNFWSMSPRRRLVRGLKHEPALIFQHMRRRIDLDMQGTPQGDTRRAVWRQILPISHVELCSPHLGNVHSPSMPTPRGPIKISYVDGPPVARGFCSPRYKFLCLLAMIS
jgi:hypothetical protein